MENKTVGIVVLPREEKDQELQKSLNPLAEKFEVDSWDKIVKRQMNKS